MTEDPCALPNARIPLGSDLYYCLRFVPSPLRATMTLMATLHCTLAAIPAECSDPGVARRKALWWQEEIGRALEGNAGHPMTRALTHRLASDPLPAVELERLPRAVVHEIDQAPFVDEGAALRHCELGMGSLCALFACICDGDGGEIDVDAARRQGGFAAAVGLIQGLGGHLRTGRPLLPARLAREHGLSLAPPFSPAARYAEAMARFAAAARQWAGPAPAGLPLPVAILRRLADATLEELERSGYPVLHSRLELTPLRRFWLSWRLTRQLQKTCGKEHVR